MAPNKPENAGEELQLFCHDTREYVYLGPLQDWLMVRYPNNPFPVLQALAQQGRVFKRLPKKQTKKKEGVSTTTRPSFPAITFVFTASAARSFQRRLAMRRKRVSYRFLKPSSMEERMPTKQSSLSTTTI
jgi:hypothetical protein